MNDYLNYYLRKDIQAQIVKIAKNREVGIVYSDRGFGKRPDTLQFENDISELAKQGVTSFHISEEHWKNPLLLKSGMTKKELDSLREGWDLILDIDSKYLEYSKVAALLIIEAIKFHNVKNISVKFSGNNGFHIAISFKAFPDKVNNIETKTLFPDGLRIIAIYLKEFIKDHLTAQLLKYGLDDLAKNTSQEKSNLIKNGVFDPFGVVDIDTILISSRHLFRAPYSINEKSGLVSLPIKEDAIINFNKELANPENVKPYLSFLDQSNVEPGEAKQLIIQAFDFSIKNKKEPEIKIIDRKIYENKDKIPEQFFPGCIKKLLVGNLSDGKKRSLFILINFLRSTGYSLEEIKVILEDWNSKNNPPLKQGYIQSQLSWHTRQKEKILPPNCNNLIYYQNLGVKDPDEICQKCKNPVNYALRAYRNSLRNKRPKRKTKKTISKF